MNRKASDTMHRFKQANGPEITTCSRHIIHKDGFLFKDIDGTGEVSTVNDWRVPAEKRAEEYAKKLSIDEKIGLLFISQGQMGINAGKPNPLYEQMGIHLETRADETGILDETDFEADTIFGKQKITPTSKAIHDLWQRYFILRDNPKPEDLADWVNQLEATCEECDHFIPAVVLSNSRNENGEAVFGMNDASGIFTPWPGTLGIAAAIRGDGMHIADEWADCIREQWNATGIRKGYMYMADVMSDPRWQRGYGTFGEDPKLISDILEHIIPRIQGSTQGVTENGVALTVKHFPGGGARENGFDPHYKEGQWNVYATENSLWNYHLQPFHTAVKYHADSIMPYYAKPSMEKSAVQNDMNGSRIPMEPYGFAYNRPFIDTLLRQQMGFEGYINSDTGILHNMSWGVEHLDVPERIGFAVNNAGTDIISGMMDNADAKESYERAHNGYYRTHPVPEGMTEEMITLSDETLDRAVTRTMTSMFRLGLFENPFRDPDTAREVFQNSTYRKQAMDAHHKSVVLLKNDGTLPLKKNMKIYAEAFSRDEQSAGIATQSLRELLKDENLVDNPAQADIAYLTISPSSGNYFSATKGYLELDICEDKEVCDVNENGIPLPSAHKETTLHGIQKIRDISHTIHSHGGKTVIHVNITLPWMMGNVEPYADALTVGFDTLPQAVWDVIDGTYPPVGRLPVTLPKNDAVLAVDENGRCISPNDVPGYDKDRYMPEDMKDENGKAYAYRDSAGNYYELDFGLTYQAE